MSHTYSFVQNNGDTHVCACAQDDVFNTEIMSGLILLTSVLVLICNSSGWNQCLSQHTRHISFNRTLFIFVCLLMCILPLKVCASPTARPRRSLPHAGTHSDLRDHETIFGGVLACTSNAGCDVVASQSSFKGICVVDTSGSSVGGCVVQDDECPSLGSNYFVSVARDIEGNFVTACFTQPGTVDSECSRSTCPANCGQGCLACASICYLATVRV